MMEHNLTIRLEIWEGDVSHYFLLPRPMPMPQIGLIEVVLASFNGGTGQWRITNTEPSTPGTWFGHGEYKNAAILDYLKARLGMYETESEVQP